MSSKFSAITVRKTLWSSRKRLDFLRQRQLFKHRRFNKKECRPVFNLILPINLNIACIYNKTQDTVFIYIHDAVAGVGYALPKYWINKIKYYSDCRILSIHCYDSQPFMHLMLADVKKVVRTFHTFFVVRLRMRGRLYRIYKRNRYRDLQYRIGFSHKITIYIEGFYVRYIRKKKIRLFGYDPFALYAKACEARDAYPVCKYTQRGVRLSGSRTFARIGKTAKYY